MNEQDYIERIRGWISSFVIDLGLCPFAVKPFREETIRYIVIEDSRLEIVLEEILSELLVMKARSASELSTTLIIIPGLDESFQEYLDAYDMVDILLEEHKLSDRIQLASFHPLYQFEGTHRHDLSNYTNRSPHSIIHLLRSEEMEQAIASHPDTALIPDQNIVKMKNLGKEEILLRLSAINSG